MTPKEKAEELIIQMYGHTIKLSDAKNCALVAVGHIRKALKEQYNKSFSVELQEVWGYWRNSTEAEYWQKVKDEVEQYEIIQPEKTPA